MPDIEELMDTVGQKISEQKPKDVNFSSMDPTYAYDQLPLSPKTSVQCNFSLVGGGGGINVHASFLNGVLRRNAGGIPKSNGYNPIGISTGTRIHRWHLVCHERHRN